MGFVQGRPLYHFYTTRCEAGYRFQTPKHNSRSENAQQKSSLPFIGNSKFYALCKGAFYALCESDDTRSRSTSKTKTAKVKLNSFHRSYGNFNYGELTINLKAGHPAVRNRNRNSGTGGCFSNTLTPVVECVPTTTKAFEMKLLATGRVFWRRETIYWPVVNRLGLSFSAPGNSPKPQFNAEDLPSQRRRRRLNVLQCESFCKRGRDGKKSIVAYLRKC